MVQQMVGDHDVEGLAGVHEFTRVRASVLHPAAATVRPPDGSRIGIQRDDLDRQPVSARPVGECPRHIPAPGADVEDADRPLPRPRTDVLSVHGPPSGDDGVDQWEALVCALQHP
jgi:hypothetical protein